MVDLRNDLRSRPFRSCARGGRSRLLAVDQPHVRDRDRSIDPGLELRDGLWRRDRSQGSSPSVRASSLQTTRPLHAAALVCPTDSVDRPVTPEVSGGPILLREVDRSSRSALTQGDRSKTTVPRPCADGEGSDSRSPGGDVGHLLQLGVADRRPSVSSPLSSASTQPASRRRLLAGRVASTHGTARAPSSSFHAQQCSIRIRKRRASDGVRGARRRRVLSIAPCRKTEAAALGVELDQSPSAGCGRDVLRRRVVFGP